MTQRKILFALKKIELAKQQGFFAEALLKNYHLNLQLLKFIFAHCSVTKSVHNKKVKIIIAELNTELNTNPRLKAIISKKSLKNINHWILKIDVFFKTLKLKEPANTKDLLAEGELVLGILNISATKIFSI